MSDQPILTPPEMPDETTEKWEAAVQETARHFAYPPTPDIAGEVRARLKPRPRRGFSRGLRLALAALLALAFITLAVPETRAFVLEVLRIGAVRIFFVEPTATPTYVPTLTTPPNSGEAGRGSATPRPTRTPRPTLPPEPTPLTSVLDLSGETTLADGERQLGSPIKLPAYPPDLGAPDHVFAQQFGGTVVTLAWVKSGDPTQVELAIQILNDQIVASKLYPYNASSQLTRVNGRQAEWLTNVHQIYFFKGNQQYTRQVDKNVLIWQEGTLTYRLETDFPLDEAMRIAESLQ